METSQSELEIVMPAGALLFVLKAASASIAFVSPADVRAVRA